MGKKYIVEIGRLERLYKAFVGAHEKPSLTWLSPEVDLTPYTEPDLEQVRKEAYEQGRKDGKIEGREEMWIVARKIAYMYSEERQKIFGENLIQNIHDIYSASEAIEKIRQYEQEKDRQARIEYNFDEIKDVLETTAKECNVSLDEIAEVLAKMKETDNG